MNTEPLFPDLRAIGHSIINGFGKNLDPTPDIEHFLTVLTAKAEEDALYGVIQADFWRCFYEERLHHAFDKFLFGEKSGTDLIFAYQVPHYWVPAMRLMMLEGKAPTAKSVDADLTKVDKHDQLYGLSFGEGIELLGTWRKAFDLSFSAAMALRARAA